MKKNDEVRLPIVLLAGLMLVWSVFIPVFEGADESGHYCHSEYIARNKRLPNFNIQDGCFLAYPPGYYAVVAPIIALRPAASFDDEQIQPNSAYISNRKRKDVFSKYIHPQSELLFKWNPLLQTVHLVRLVSIVLGLGIIFLTIKAAKLVTKFRSLSFASVILFFNPMFLHMFSLVSNVTLVSFLAAAFIYLHLKQEVNGCSRKLALLQGVVMGLGSITKINMLSLVGGYVFALLTSKWKGREKLKHLGFVGLGFIASAAWYIRRTYKLYGEPFEIAIAAGFRGGSMTKMRDLGFVNYWSSFPDTTIRTFWSGFGLLKIWFPDIVVTLLFFTMLALLVRTLREWRTLDERLKILWMYLVAIFIGHMIINMWTEAFHAKDLFIGYLPLSLLFGEGFRRTVGKSMGWTRKIPYPAVYLIAFLFYAKFELVRVAKLVLQAGAVTGFYQQEPIDVPGVAIALGVKAMTVLLMGVLIRSVLRVIQKKQYAKWVLPILAIANMGVLGYTSYTLYHASNAF